MKKLVFIIFLVAIIFIISSHLAAINSRESKIDYLDNVLAPIKPFLENKTSIPLIIQEGNLKLYYQTQFVLVPTIVERETTDRDTILLIKKKEEKISNLYLKEYKILYSKSNSYYQAVLYLKNK